MSRNERVAWIHIIFLKTFHGEGHFGDAEQIGEAIAGLEKVYDCRTRTQSEYNSMIRAVDRISNSLRGNESSLEMMILWAGDIAERYMAHTGSLRKYAWQLLYEAVTASGVYRALIARVPTMHDLTASEYALEVCQLFDIAMKQEGVA